MSESVNLTAPPSGAAERMMRRFAWFRRQSTFYPLVGLVVVGIVMAATSNTFVSLANFSNVLVQVSINALIAVGMTFVILTGGIDLSVGAVMALSGTIAAMLMVSGVNATLSLFVCVAAGFAIGMINGMCVAYGRMPAIIVTLATMGVARGLALMITGGYPVDGLPEWVRGVGNGHVIGIQTPIIVMAVVYVIAWVLLELTPFGRHLYAIGGNEVATRLSGIRVARYKMLAYVVSGVTTGIAAVVLTGRLMSGQPNVGEGSELDAIAAVVLGGTSIAGGRGSVIGTLLGALLLGVLNNGLNMVGVSPYAQIVIKGMIILLAIYIGRERRR